MNTVSGVITRMHTHDSFTVTTVRVRGKGDVAVITLELKDAFRPKATVSLLFKESDVIIATGRCSRLSVENRFACTVAWITAGDVFVEMELTASFGAFRAVIGRAVWADLAVKPGDDVYAFVKANEISLAMNEG